MQRLEKYMDDHREEFDTSEPEPGHFRRFEDRLAQQRTTELTVHNRSLLLRIAALVLILVCVSVFIFDLATSEIRQRFAGLKQGMELPQEIRDAEQYYDNQTRTQMAAIGKLAESHKDAGALSASALKEIQNLYNMTNELKESLAKTPGNERILDAIIQNQRMKETMLNTIIMQLSQNQN